MIHVSILIGLCVGFARQVYSLNIIDGGWSNPFNQPGPFPGSFVAPSFFKGADICDVLVGPAPFPSTVCKGEIQPNNDLRAVGHAQPLQCLKDKLYGAGGVYSKMCMLCALPELDGIAWANVHRKGLPCSARYAMLNRIAAAIMRSDGSIVESLRQGSEFIHENQAKYRNVDEALRDTINKKAVGSSGQLADIDNDGKVTLEEQKAFLHAVYAWTDTAQEVLAKGTPAELEKLGNLKYVDWLQFAPGFQHPQSWE